ncbi:MAG: PAS domain-containing protein [Nitrospiraceae bacterium]|nr:PAS domain-containing protein [Nitrospiraceae bacterium]
MLFEGGQGLCLASNRSGLSIMGRKKSEVIGKNLSQIFLEEFRPIVDEAVKKVLAGRQNSFEAAQSLEDGSKVTWSAVLSPIFDKTGKVGRFTGIFTDISERKSVEGALREEKVFTESALNSIQDIFFVFDLEGRFLRWNRTLNLVSAYSDVEIAAMKPADFFPEEQRCRITDAVRKVIHGGSARVEAMLMIRDGKKIPYEFTVSLLKDNKGKIIGISGTGRDITERRHAEEALQKSEAFIKNILENVDEGFIVVDKEYRILSANKAFCSAVNMNQEQARGMTCYKISHGSGRPCSENGEECPVKRVFETGAASAASHRHTCRNGSKLYHEIKAFPIKDGAGAVVAAIETINDVTEKKLLEEQLRHAQKLESVGTLAGGIAHDFNNILTAIVGYGEMMMMRMPEEEPNIHYLREILAAAERATRLTQSLLIFSRKQTTDMEPVSVNALIEGIRKMMLRLIGEDIEVSISPAPGNPVVIGDQGQLEQILMNFVTNARDSMPNGGSLRIETRLQAIDSEFINKHGFGKPGMYVLISVSDTGEGMDEKTRCRIFEPFFTTKGVGKGTGLGLSIVYGIVKQHLGYITCDSEPRIGTTFDVYLPVAREELLGRRESGREEIVGGGETVLVADDDASIRNLTRELLEKFGYKVLEAKDGSDAVSIFLEQKEKIDLVLLDVILPKKNGREVFEEIRGIKPGAKILFMSGYTEDILHRQRILEDKLPLLPKPAKPKELLIKIREILDAAI